MVSLGVFQLGNIFHSLDTGRCLRNQPLREAYCIEKQLMLRERGEDQVNEQLLLHGTSDLKHSPLSCCFRLGRHVTQVAVGCCVLSCCAGTRTFDPLAIIEDRDGFMVEKGALGQVCLFSRDQ